MDQDQFSDPDFISGKHQREKCPICRLYVTSILYSGIHYKETDLPQFLSQEHIYNNTCITTPYIVVLFVFNGFIREVFVCVDDHLNLLIVF